MEEVSVVQAFGLFIPTEAQKEVEEKLDRLCSLVQGLRTKYDKSNDPLFQCVTEALHSLVHQFHHQVTPLLLPKTPKVPLKISSPKTRKKKAKAAPSSDIQYCRQCNTSQSRQWRRGPDGYKSLCNACGLHFAKLVKKEQEETYQPRRMGINELLNQ